MRGLRGEKSMELYLVRHGEANPKQISASQELTAKGKTDVFKVGKFLKNADIKIDTLWHSSKTRAVQTAQILADIITIGKENILERQDLSPLDPVNKVQEEIITHGMNLMIVGHLPFLQKLTSLLLIGSEYEELVSFSSAGVVCFKQQENKWYLAWIITPDLIKGD